MVFQGNLGTGEIVMGAFAIAGSVVIILTYFMFPNLRKLRYIELVFYIAINDLMASIGLAIGPVPNDSFACWFQALSTDICYVSSAFWTVVILYQVYLVVVERGSVLKNIFYIHCFCWGWPVVLAILPLSTNTYNNPDDEGTWCFISSRRDSPAWGELFWVVFSFFFWIWLSIVVNTVQIVQIMLELRDMQVVSTAVTSTVRKLILYPLITFLCWTLNTIANLYVFSANTTFAGLDSGWSTLASVGVLLALSQGLLNAFVFVGMNTIVREHWKELFYRIYMLLCCCKVVKERTIERKNTSYGDVESPVHGKQVFELEMSTHDSGRFENPTRARDSTSNLFRDTFAQDQGVRLSAYFSVSLPVEDQSDYIGDVTDHTAYRTDRPNSGPRNRRASNFDMRDSNFMRRSSLVEMVRGSIAMFIGSGGVEGGSTTDVVASSVKIEENITISDTTVGTTSSSPVIYTATAHSTCTIDEERESQVSVADYNTTVTDVVVEEPTRDSEYLFEHATVNSEANPLHAVCDNTVQSAHINVDHSMKNVTEQNIECAVVGSDTTSSDAAANNVSSGTNNGDCNIGCDGDCNEMDVLGGDVGVASIVCSDNSIECDVVSNLEQN